MAVFGAIELARLARTPRTKAFLIPLGIAIALFEMFTVLALRAHWTMDVYAGAVSALLIACVVTRLAPPVDRLLARVTGVSGK
jgi:membrane-associated phospholipid phosphatase